MILCVKIDSGNGLLPDSTKLSLEPMFVYHWQSCGFYLWEVLMISVCEKNFKIAILTKILPHLAEANELSYKIW